MAGRTALHSTKQAQAIPQIDANSAVAAKKAAAASVIGYNGRRMPKSAIDEKDDSKMDTSLTWKPRSRCDP